MIPRCYNCNWIFISKNSPKTAKKSQIRNWVWSPKMLPAKVCYRSSHQKWDFILERLMLLWFYNCNWYLEPKMAKNLTKRAKFEIGYEVPKCSLQNSSIDQGIKIEIYYWKRLILLWCNNCNWHLKPKMAKNLLKIAKF